MQKITSFWKLQVLHKRSSDISSLVEHSLHNILEVNMSWTLLLSFTLAPVTQIAGVKLIFSENPGSSVKEAVMLLF